MPSRFSLNRYDGLVILASILLLFVGYVVYPVEIVTVSMWFAVFAIYLGWMAYTLYRFAFDEE